ncbi:hypothetical protein VNI00_015311 [Paramarasmius palmivorus]|uniref:endo-polygalacturonase n=1 Tax=Paramarasmius palmivorus TaxID=297713 RepID=A0AAW0BMD6_9AGAR
MYSLFAITTASFAGLSLASPLVSRCTGTISSLDDVTDAVKCTEIDIESFEVPAGQTFELDLTQGTTVNIRRLSFDNFDPQEGNITFGVSNWDGPLFKVSGKDITFNGNGYTFDGNGPDYWDGQGLNGGVTKPAPMMKIEISGVYQDVIVLNSPARAYSVDSSEPLLMTSLTVDDSLGDQPNSMSDGKPAGHNTDGFDVSASNLVISNSKVNNQDDCLAINKGTNITFTGNTCTGGHGISIGSVSSNVVVSDIQITNNMVINNQQGFRIKTDADATNSSVSSVTYSGNTATGCTDYGVIVDQSYPSTLGTPGNGVTISDINFTGSETDVAVSSDAERVAVNCGSGSCTGTTFLSVRKRKMLMPVFAEIGTWNWSELEVSGGEAGSISGFSGITGFSQS